VAGDSDLAGLDSRMEIRSDPGLSRDNLAIMGRETYQSACVIKVLRDQGIVQPAGCCQTEC